MAIKTNEIQHIELSSLKPYPHNVKEHPKKQIDDLKTMMSDSNIGYTYPIIIDETNTILAGHGRVQAMKELGETMIPCFRMEGLTESQKAEIIIYDNKVAESTWDPKNFKIVMEKIDPIIIEQFEINFNDITMSNTQLAEAEWTNMPEFVQEDKSAYRKLIVNFNTESEVQEFAQIIGQTITDKTKYIWHPFKPQRKTGEYGWEDES